MNCDMQYLCQKVIKKIAKDNEQLQSVNDRGSGELLEVIKVAHLSHMTSMSRNKLTPAEGDKSLEHEQLLSELGGCPTKITLFTMNVCFAEVHMLHGRHVFTLCCVSVTPH